MIEEVQDVLSQPQNWTVLGVLAAVLLSTIGLLVWIVKWLCTRFASSVDGCSTAVGKVGDAIDSSTSTQSKLVTRVEDLHASHKDLKQSIDTLPQRFADELHRRRSG